MEEWKEVEGYTSYIVSNTGVIKEKSIDRVMPQTVNGGFWCTNLVSDSGKKALCKVHRLVAIAFVPNPEGSYFVDPIGDRLNTNANNLIWRPKTIKPEKVVKAEEVISYLGVEYMMTEFVNLCKADRNTVRARLKSGWTSVECVVGVRSFQGIGYEDGSIWYPTKDAYNKAMSVKRAADYLKYKEKVEIERKEGIKQRKQNRADYKKWGVGNFVNYPIPGIVGRQQLKVYRVWSGIISRCYSKKNKNYKRYGGRGVYTCAEWLEFQGFAAWYNEQYKGDDWHIDKDILVEGNLVYSPETCTFVPPNINTFFATLPKNKGFLPTLNFDKGGYKASVSDGNYKYNKTFKTQHEGFVFYKKFKEDRAKELAKEFEGVVDQRVTQALLDFTVTLPLES